VSLHFSKKQIAQLTSFLFTTTTTTTTQKKSLLDLFENWQNFHLLRNNQIDFLLALGGKKAKSEIKMKLTNEVCGRTRTGGEWLAYILFYLFIIIIC
jgi:hypothetical protein